MGTFGLNTMLGASARSREALISSSQHHVERRLAKTDELDSLKVGSLLISLITSFTQSLQILSIIHKALYLK